jgi:hypothetical protein
MTLSELADLVCAKCHRTDDASVTEAKTYLKSRYRMLWDSRPWRDSIGLLSLDSSQVSQITTLPANIDRIMQIRWGGDKTLLPQELGTIFQVDPAMFDRTGSPATFSIISPSGVSSSPGGAPVFVFSSNSSASFKVSIRGSFNGNPKSEVIQVSGTSQVSSTNNYDEIYSLSKSTTGYPLTVLDSTLSNTILSLDTWETSRTFQRIHFDTIPDEAKTCLILFKRTFRPLVNDSDSPELTGIDNAILASAIADMLEGQRQYGKAQIKMQEASMMASQMADLERHQSASAMQLIPWDAAMAPDYYATTNYIIP